MICETCKKDLNGHDFVGSGKECYKCLYQRKLKNCKTKKKEKICQVCSHVIPHDDTLKIRQRNTFCSEECSIIGLNEKRKNYWTMQLKARYPLC